MPDTYAQLLNSYAHDLQWRLKQTEKETLDQIILTVPMANEHKLDLSDQLTALRSRCCTESFSMGIQLGLRIAWEFSEK